TAGLWRSVGREIGANALGGADLLEVHEDGIEVGLGELVEGDWPSSSFRSSRRHWIRPLGDSCMGSQGCANLSDALCVSAMRGGIMAPMLPGQALGSRTLVPFVFGLFCTAASCATPSTGLSLRSLTPP